MKARLLKKWGTHYAGQVLTNVSKGSIPSDVAEFFEDDNDPAVMTVVEQTSAGDPLTVLNDEINPAHAKAHNEAQRASAKASAEVGSGQAGALAALEEEQTQERARHADKIAAKRSGTAKGEKSALSEGQKRANAAGKGPAKGSK